ncbi:sulfotransferase family protein [Lutimonas sp.]|uniref:sulfotransferase family protein n=1 Tax=Lutimonas sp. TaxID=1872403 RepID=UPI003D9B92D7
MMKNEKKGFLLPPAVGYSFQVIVYLFANHLVSFRFLLRTIITLLINVINWPFRVYEKLFINKKYKSGELEKAPIFIIGHWRSGTTHLHNILCQDKQMAYVSTFQSVFPDTLFNKLGRFIFEGFARILIPGTRKGDNVQLGTGLPQEEEFALGDKTPISFYYFWMFPRSIHTFFQRCVRFAGVKETAVDAWKSDYRLMINKALKDSGGQRFLSKNPPNTGRIEKILEMFPNAKFIHIHRNPVEVFLSTQNFFNKMLPHLQLQTIDAELLTKAIFDLYKDIMHDYLEQSPKVPKGQLVEISFEALEKNPQLSIKTIYEELNVSGYEKSIAFMESYLDSKKSYQKNTHQMTRELLAKIQSEWGFAMKHWSYDIPANIEFIDE